MLLWDEQGVKMPRHHWLGKDKLSVVHMAKGDNKEAQM